MAERLLEGIRVVDVAAPPAQMTGRILADLGADVLKVEPPGGDPARGEPLRFAAWNAGKTSVVLGPDDAELPELLGGADVVIETPGWRGGPSLDRGLAPSAVWVSITPFGLHGPRAAWRASDLGIMAASGNMYATGDGDRPPVRCTQPSGYAHLGSEAAMAVLTALASGRPQLVDVAGQEAVMAADMCAPATFVRTGARGTRRGANIGRSREIWPCRDGFVSFGLRGGKARVPSLQTITRLVTEAGMATPALTERDWTTYSHVTATDEELAAIERPVAAYFASRTMAELYEVACETNLMLAPANTPPQIYDSAQLTAREMFGPVGSHERFPLRFVLAHGPDGAVIPVTARGPAPGAPVAGGRPGWTPRRPPAPAPAHGPAWAGTKILELGSGAAGPIATRYFAEHGATVIRIESPSRPDFLRVYALGPDNPHGLEGSTLFDGLNPGKLSVTLNLKHPDGVALARRLVAWSDAVAENFAPKAMRAFGLDYERLAADRPDLVMVSACLNGQTGPHRDYPGFGGQGAALSGYNALTGWPDREPVGPFGTITDSLSPRFVATALAAGLLYRRRTGRGVYLDVSQVEAAVYTLSPWLLDFAHTGVVAERDGNRSPGAVPHGAFPCQGEDRWVALAAWDDDEWARLAELIGVDDPSLATLDARLARIEEVEGAVAQWTGARAVDDVVATIQSLGIEAVPVQDFGDVVADPQLAARGHFVTLTHPAMGEGIYERNGFRLSDAPSGYTRTGPTLGQDNDHVLREILGLSTTEIDKLAADGALD
ncbi:MAG TPA: CoA transferase [Acidimicrobiales bacterium]|nr:CoA transferase [Acidimicrobiales bacterium]